MAKGCAVCGISTETLKQCSRCKQVLYCSKAHQVQDWRGKHKSQCQPGSLDVAVNVNQTNNKAQDSEKLQKSSTEKAAVVKVPHGSDKKAEKKSEKEEKEEKAAKKSDKAEEKSEKVEKKSEKVGKKSEKVEKKGEKVEKKSEKAEKSGEKVEKSEKVEKKSEKEEKKAEKKAEKKSGKEEKKSEKGEKADKEEKKAAKEEKKAEKVENSNEKTEDKKEKKDEKVEKTSEKDGKSEKGSKKGGEKDSKKGGEKDSKKDSKTSGEKDSKKGDEKKGGEKSGKKGDEKDSKKGGEKDSKKGGDKKGDSKKGDSKKGGEKSKKGEVAVEKSVPAEKQDLEATLAAQGVKESAVKILKELLNAREATERAPSPFSALSDAVSSSPSAISSKKPPTHFPRYLDHLTCGAQSGQEGVAKALHTFQGESYKPYPLPKPQQEVLDLTDWRGKINEHALHTKNPSLLLQYEVGDAVAQWCGTFLNDLFKNCSTEDAAAILKTEGNPVDPQTGFEMAYGEVTFATMGYLLLKSPSVHLRPGGVFYDLGAGAGRAVFAAAIMAGFDKCVALDISPALCDLCGVLHQTFQRQTLPVLNKTLASPITTKIEVAQGDIRTFDWSDGDFVFANSTCFGDDLMTDLGRLGKKLKVGAYLITTSKPIKSQFFQLLEVSYGLMSYGYGTVLVYARVDPLLAKPKTRRGSF